MNEGVWCFCRCRVEGDIVVFRRGGVIMRWVTYGDSLTDIVGQVKLLRGHKVMIY